MNRSTPHVRVRRDSPNKSSRRGAGIRGIVLHSTEGANRPGLGDLVDLGGWFANPSAQVSAHIAVDAEGNSARYVRDADKAWHCAGYNSLTIGIEQVGFAAQSGWPQSQLQEVARWIAYLSRQHRIPIQRGAAAGGAITRAGVLTHAQLGALGGGHNDPGTAYPLDKVLRLARRYA